MTARQVLIGVVVTLVMAPVVLVAGLWLTHRGDAALDDDPRHVIPDPGPDAVSFHVSEVDGSGQTGAATLDPREGDRTLVAIKLTAPTETEQPVHIHAGTCDDLGQIVHRLEPMEPQRDPGVGTSITTVDANLVIPDRPLAIDVHAAPWDDRVRACGELPGRTALVPEAEPLQSDDR